MLDNPIYASNDERLVRALIAENPWATIVSATNAGLIASHYPILLDESHELALLIHVGRADAEIHGLGSREVLVIVAGPHGYISPSWYSPEASPVPTWNFIVAHLYGIPRLLDAEENTALLRRLTGHFERGVASPVALDDEVVSRLAPHTVGLRLPVERFVCKVKMSQEESSSTQAQIVAALRRPGRYANPILADQIQSTLAATCDSSERATPPELAPEREPRDRRRVRIAAR